jgi:hypothetical protein
MEQLGDLAALSPWVALMIPILTTYFTALKYWDQWCHGAGADLNVTWATLSGIFAPLSPPPWAWKVC